MAASPLANPFGPQWYGRPIWWTTFSPTRRAWAWPLTLYLAARARLLPGRVRAAAEAAAAELGVPFLGRLPLYALVDGVTGVTA